MPTILLDENLDGYTEYVARSLFSPTWLEVSESLDVKVVSFDDVGLEKGIQDDVLWDFCQGNEVYLLTDNRNTRQARLIGGNDPIAKLVLASPCFHDFRYPTFSFGSQLRRGRCRKAAGIPDGCR